jgi:S-adenosylmethionine hydrolase
MSVITITTDLGTTDYYLAALKGALLKAASPVQLVDINCHIRPFDVRQAAYNIREAHRFFPEQTIHIAHINPGFAKARILIAKCKGQFFISFDNSLISLLPKEFSQEVYALKAEYLVSHDFFFSESLAFVVQHIIAGKELNSIAEICVDFKQKNLPAPAITNSGLKGSVVAIDLFGNVMTNIHKDVFSEYVQHRNYVIAINHIRLKEVSAYYNSVSEGDLVAVFNSSGFLEIAINRGKASTLLGISIDNAVFVILQ